MQTLGTAASPERYARFTIKERILAEIERRIDTKDWTFATVAWGKVVRYPIPDDFDGKAGPCLAIVDTAERFGITATGYQNECSIDFEFALKVGAKEKASTVLNLITGDLIERMAGDHQLVEGGTPEGTPLSCTFYPESYEPDLVDAASGGVVRGLLTFRLVFRHKTHRPFDLR